MTWGSDLIQCLPCGSSWFGTPELTSITWFRCTDWSNGHDHSILLGLEESTAKGGDTHWNFRIIHGSKFLETLTKWDAAQKGLVNVLHERTCACRITAEPWGKGRIGGQVGLAWITWSMTKSYTRKCEEPLQRVNPSQDWNWKQGTDSVKDAAVMTDCDNVQTTIAQRKTGEGCLGRTNTSYTNLLQY